MDAVLKFCHTATALVAMLDTVLAALAALAVLAVLTALAREVIMESAEPEVRSIRKRHPATDVFRTCHNASGSGCGCVQPELCFLSALPLCLLFCLC